MKTLKHLPVFFSLMLMLAPAVWATTYSLGTTNLLEGPAAASDSVVLAANSSWTATTNATWLHLSAANQSGTVSTNVIFTFDANTGVTRTGTLTIAGQTVTITQAGSTYVATTNTTTLVSSGLSGPSGVVVNGAGNVYIADTGHNAIKKWTATNNTVSTLVSSGLLSPEGLAVDGSGNVFIADTGNGAIKKWAAANSNVTTLVSSVIPYGMTMDGAGNIYFINFVNVPFPNTTVAKWTAANNNVTTLVSSGLLRALNVAVDIASNVYIADTGHGAIKEWTAANSTVTTLISSGLPSLYGVAMDGSGNVYIADKTNNVIEMRSAANNSVATLVSSNSITPLYYPYDVAVDGSGNVFITDSGNNAIKELPHAFVDTTPKLEGLAAGTDNLPVVLPATANLHSPFAPTSDQSWLIITGTNNGVVSFAFTTNSGPARTAHINLLGQSIAITQGLIGTAPNLTGIQNLGNGVIQFSFTNNPSATFTVWTSTNLSLPFTNWTQLGTPTNNGSGQYGFTDPTATNGVQRFYRVSSP